MPSRPFAILIILFWLAISGWFLYRDLSPRFQSDGSPPYTFKVVDEARRIQIRWRVLRQRGEVSQQFRANTDLDYLEEEDAFLITSEVFRAKRPLYEPGVVFTYQESKVHYSRDGRLRDIEFLVRFEAAMTGFPLNYLESKTFVNFQQQNAALAWERNWAEPNKGEWDPLKYESYYRRTVLPLQPFSQIQALIPGQRWRAPMIDLYAQGLSDQLPEKRPILWLEATVHPPSEKTTVDWHANKYQCLLLEYLGNNTTIRYYVLPDAPHTVLRYEYHQHGESWIYRRS